MSTVLIQIPAAAIVTYPGAARIRHLPVKVGRCREFTVSLESRP